MEQSDAFSQRQRDNLGHLWRNVSAAGARRRDNERRLEIEVFIRKHLTSVFQATSSHRRPSRRVLNYFCLPSFLPPAAVAAASLQEGKDTGEIERAWHESKTED